MLARWLGLHAVPAFVMSGALALPACAHEIPADVTVLAFVKPEGQRLRVLLRVPMRAMRDVDFPKRAQGLLDVGRAEPSLRDAVSLWIVHDLQVCEGDSALAEPRI